jgi:hypothetical protein
LIDQRLVDSHESFSFSHGRLHSYLYYIVPVYEFLVKSLPFFKMLQLSLMLPTFISS